MTRSVSRAARHWWVNQNQTHKDEVRGSFMWSPKRNANGARNQFYENMRAVAPGDVVLSYYDTRIQALGIVAGRGETGPKPDFGVVGANWSKEGWFVPVDYCRLNSQIRPKDHIAILRPLLPEKYSPLQPTGDGLQSVYLAEVPLALADALIALIGQPYWDAYSTLETIKSRYIPDFLIRLSNGKTLVLEVKGEDGDQHRAKTSAMNAWVAGVNAKGGFGTWCHDVAYQMAKIQDILEFHGHSQ